MKKLLWHRSRSNLHRNTALNGNHHSTVKLMGLRIMAKPSLIGWVVVAGLFLVFAPPVQAYTTEDLLTVSREAGEDYTALSRRAEMAARSMAQQRFDSDILLTRVLITVLGENAGETAPILVMDVSRNDWRSRPDPQRWSKYYRSTRALLDLDIIPTTVTLPAGTVPTPAPIPSSSPPAIFPTPLPAPAPVPDAPLPSGSASPSSINIPATPPGQVGLPRSILR